MTERSELSESEQQQIRKEKRAAFLETGQAAYPAKLKITDTIETIRAEFETGKIGAEGSDYAQKPELTIPLGEMTKRETTISGRVMFLRDAGKLAFVTLQSGSGARIQAMLSAGELKDNQAVQEEDKVNGEGAKLDSGAASLKLFKRIVDLGDFLCVTGVVSSSKRGELSVFVNDWQLASKALRPLPVLHKELNEESRVRRRYVDLIVNDQARKMVQIRSKVVKSLRKNFDLRDFTEVETPMLQTIHGGAAARPFSTHMNAFDIELFLRIAPELFLKRAVVGGIDRVFEINRNFRNEGADRSHSPEFAMLEAYQSYADYNDMADLTQNLVQQAALDTFGTLQVELFADERNSDEDGNKTEAEIYSFEDSAWSRITMYGSLSEKIGFEVTPETTVEKLVEEAKKAGLEKDVLGKDKETGKTLPPPTHGKLVELLWEHYVGDHLYSPTFVFDFPVETSPLTRDHRETKGLVEKWDLYVRGFELATAYSELVDPVIQRERLVAQAKAGKAGDDEAMPLDNDFLEAMEFGMPPTGGMGMGIDRLIIALTGGTIRDTILFPLVKPQS